MLKHIDISQYDISEKLSNDNNNEFSFNLPHSTFLSHSSPTDNNFIVIKEFHSISTNQFSNILRNVELINSISHSCIANALGFFQGSQKIPPSLIYTYYPLRSVNDLIKSIKSGNISSKYHLFNGTHFMKICYGVAYAMNLMHLHNPQFIHRDLRAETVLLNENFEPFLSGYGISEANSNKKYVAPEIIKNSNTLNDSRSLPPSDVYAYGVFIKKLLKAFLISSNISQYKNQQSFNYLISLIKSCKASNPLNRPNFNQILIIFNNIEFQNSLKNMQNMLFNEESYDSYCKHLIDAQTNEIPLQTRNNKSDIDTIFGPLDKTSQDNIILRENNIQTPSQQELNVKPILPKNSNMNYSGKIASHMLSTQPKGRTTMMNQQFANSYSYQNQYQPQQQIQPEIHNKFQTSTSTYPHVNNSYSSQPAFSKPSTISTNNRNNMSLASRTYNNINPSPEEYKNPLKKPQIRSRPSESFIITEEEDAPSTLVNPSNNTKDHSNINNENKTKNSDGFNDLDSFNTHNNKILPPLPPAAIQPPQPSLSILKTNTIKNDGINNNKLSGRLFNVLKPRPESGSGKTRLLGPSLLHLGSTGTNISVDDIYDDAMHNDKGDTVYLNIIRASKLFKEAADRGHIDAMYRLGVKLIDGVGVKPNVYDAVFYFKKSWDVGMKSESASHLAEIYLTNTNLKNIEEGERYLDESLRANDLYANFLVVKLFVESKKLNYFYCCNRSGKTKAEIESAAAREASISMRFCLRREYKLISPIFVEFAKMAPKSFFDSIERDAASDPSAMFYLGILCHKSIINSPPSRVISLLENSFSKKYRSAFNYFINNNLEPSSTSANQKGPFEVIKGAKLAKSGNVNEAFELLRKGSESCKWAPDYESIHNIVSAMKNGAIDAKPVLDLLTFYADNGSGPAKEELGIILTLGINTEKSVSKGLFYLKSAFDDLNYEMKNYQLLHDNCPGFYYEPS